MKLTIILSAVVLFVAIVSSSPVPQNEGLRSQALDRLVMVEGDNEEALRSKRTIGVLRQLFPELSKNVNPEADDRLIEDAAESQNNEVRVQFADEQSNSAANEAGESELAPLEDIEVSDDENRNKRFLNFGFGGSGGAGAGASSGSGGGSGNFLFDIIRLVAGSGSSQANDVAAGAPSPGGRNDGTAEAVPGPVTRLFVIANRGISNLIQDLILRLAATSERIVNFKARLITSII